MDTPKVSPLFKPYTSVIFFLVIILCTSITAEVRSGVVQNPWNEYNNYGNIDILLRIHTWYNRF